MLKRYILFLKNNPVITAIIAIVYSIFCIKFFKAETNLELAIHRSMLSGAMMFFLYQISGDKTLTNPNNSTWYVIKVALGFLVLSLILGTFSLLVSVTDGQPYDNIPLEIIILFFAFLFVGLFEELAFRAIINDAIIYQFRNKKYVFVLSAICCFLFFGVVHIIGSKLDTSLAWAQAILKTVQTGIFGLSLLFLYWKTRNVWACGLVHGLSDFFLGINLAFVKRDTTSITYVSNDPEVAKKMIIFYLIIIAIYAVITLFVYLRIGKKIDYEKIRQEW